MQSIFYSIIINGTPTKSFVPHRVLPHGDSLSPYLFLICIEGFLGLMKQAMEVGNITLIKVARNRPTVSHLLVVNENLVFPWIDIS